MLADGIPSGRKVSRRLNGQTQINGFFAVLVQNLPRNNLCRVEHIAVVDLARRSDIILIEINVLSLQRGDNAVCQLARKLLAQNSKAQIRINDRAFLLHTVFRRRILRRHVRLEEAHGGEYERRDQDQNDQNINDIQFSKQFFVFHKYLQIGKTYF